MLIHNSRLNSSGKLCYVRFLVLCQFQDLPEIGQMSKEDYYGELGDEKGQNSQTFPENISSWKSDNFPTKSTQFPKVRKTTHPLVHY